MKICVISDRFSRFGAGGQYRIQGMAKYLQKQGIDVVLCCPHYSTTDLNDFLQVRAKQNFPLGWYDNTVKLALQVRKIKDVDAYLIDLPSPIVKGIVGLLIKMFYNKPVFIDFGDSWYSDEDGWMYKKLSTYLVKKYCEKFDGVSVPTKHMKRQIEKLSPKTKKVRYFPFGIDFEMFDSKNLKDLHLPFTKENDIILYQGYISKRKGCHYLPWIAEEVIFKRQVKNARFLVVGEGPYLDDLKKDVKKRGLDGFFHFVGFVPYDLIPSYINVASICLALSPRREDVRYGDNLSKISDCIAMGKPLISANTGGVEEIITQNVDGLYTDVEQIPDKIVELLKDKSVAESIGEKARQKAREKFDWNVIMKDLVSYWFGGTT